MMHTSFDTLEATKIFISSGMKPEIAESVAQVISASRKTDLNQLASKTDLMEVDNKIEKHASDSENRLENKIGAIQTELLKTENRIDSKIAAVQTELLKVEGRLEAKISSVDSRLSIETERMLGAIEKSRNDTVRWLIATIVTIVGAMSGVMAVLLKLFIH